MRLSQFPPGTVINLAARGLGPWEQVDRAELERREFAEAWHRQWLGKSAPTPVRRETTAEERAAREFAEAWQGMSQ